MTRKILIVGRLPPRPGSLAASVLEAAIAAGDEVTWQDEGAGRPKHWRVSDDPPTPRGPQPRGKKGKPRHW